MEVATEPIAIVGSACRFPGEANSPSQLWELLRNPSDVLTDFPRERLRLWNFYHRSGEHHGSTNVRNKSYLLTGDPYQFDASFFNVNPLEAQAMDPQQRILLETVYEALERAGCPLEKIHGTKTSVFVGVMNADYYDIQLRDPETMAQYNATGTARSILSNRISYFFGLNGPSMTIDTACSSSLVALHQAVMSLKNGESTSAIVAGANLLLDPSMYIAESKLHMLSPDSRSRMWDKSANGYARGEGFSAVFLKPLRQALEDGDDVECIIRGTGVNSDGRTRGITMPSAIAQAELIRDTYGRAGLDPVADRPQFVECHGTGTAAGDPIEARAISEAFFDQASMSTGILSVGSVKTVIGHLEGCAGLAGILKASLAIQNRIIPPNLLFDELSASVKPFYEGIQIPTESVPWPDSYPMRASVNSFGFGGTNAHVILEAYNGTESFNTKLFSVCGTAEDFVGPLTFSANSQSALRSMVKQHFDFMKANPTVDLRGLAWTLQSRRSVLPYRTFFSGATPNALLKYMDQAIQSSESNGAEFGVRASQSQETPAILGIFTGQGAQWATMGSSLIHASPLFRNSIQLCEKSLAALPDPPAWSLMDEILAGQTMSLISKASHSQPLCTALQIAMVDLCSAAGIRFAAVVGHSSGEIAAAYAAGILSAWDAIRISYYRGYHAELACGPGEVAGAMIAVGMSLENATAFCSRSPFQGQIGVAASNSPLSVTLSGNLDTILAAKEMLDSEKVFARRLQVDTAYHSHHMLRCTEPYLRSLNACKIQVTNPHPGCVWVSSVRGDVDILEDGNLSSLQGQYWVDNMVKPVLFSQALECSLWAGGPFEMVLELGPHPALKGPATQTLKSSLGASPPYAGMMRRLTNEVEAFSGGVGYVWSHLAKPSIDFESYQQAFLDNPGHRERVLKTLPSYPWQHYTAYRKESRISRQFRLRDTPYHELLGRRCPDDSDFEMRWRNVLRLSELGWIGGHEFQGQALFPAMGYISMALEAARSVINGQSIRLIEVENFAVHQAVVLEPDHAGVETIFTLKKSKEGTWVFSCYACSDESNENVAKTCSGSLTIRFGESSADELPCRPKTRSALSPLDRDMFYRKLSSLGLNYHGIFKPQLSFRRGLSYATGCASWSTPNLNEGYIVHPAVMDVSLHSIFVAFACPMSHRLCATYLPVYIRRFSFNPNIELHNPAGEVRIEVHTFVTQSSLKEIEADVHVSPGVGGSSMLIEGVQLQSFSEGNPSSDRLLFSTVKWDVDVCHGFSAVEVTGGMLGRPDLFNAMERTSLFFMRKVVGVITPAEIDEAQSHFRRLYAAALETTTQIENGDHMSVKKEWLDDTQDTIMGLLAQFPSSVDLQMMHAIGNNLPMVIKGNTSLLEVMIRDNMLQRFYADGRLFVPLNKYLAASAGAVAHKHPNMRILEIGAGTGATTKAILDGVGRKFSSYTYTDISSGFFAQAQEEFSALGQRMNFQTLDIEKDVSEQGFNKHSYDMVIAANVLHATFSLQETMNRVRSLLRPGGYLLLIEVTGETLQLMYVMGGFPGWWLGAGDGRTHSPGISLAQWHGLLQRTGFSGVGAWRCDLEDQIKHSCSAIISQAVDDTIRLLREPLQFIDMINIPGPVIIIGGSTLPIAKLATGIHSLLQPHRNKVEVVTYVEELPMSYTGPRTIIFLSELDHPLFLDRLTDARLAKIQSLIRGASHILWTTRARLSKTPHSNMVVALGRTLQFEQPDIRQQFLDVGPGTNLTATHVVEKFLQLIAWSSKQLSEEQVLWSAEPELLLEEGRWTIPRVVSSNTLNDRYNAARRKIRKYMDPSRESVETTYASEKVSLRENGQLKQTLQPGTVRLHMVYTTCLVAHERRSFWLCLGSAHETGCPALAILTRPSSIIDIPPSNLFMIPSGSCDKNIFSAVVGVLLCLAILSAVPSDRPFSLYEPSQLLAETLSRCLSSGGKKVYFATSRELDSPCNWIYLHPKASRNMISHILPNDASTLVNCSPSQPSLDFGQNIVNVLAADSCIWNHLARNYGSHQALVAQAFSEAMFQPMDGGLKSATLISLGEVDELPASEVCYPRVVYWDDQLQVPATTAPLDCSNMFSLDKTYLMVGLNSELGISICRWMVDNGAKYIVITSRSGKVDPGFLEEMSSIGAVLKVYPMDITCREAVQSVCELVTQSMPPIAGVCNGAMVLFDRLFAYMSADDMNAVLAPKVDGSLYLHEQFSSPSLDFFIMFSSLASVVGNAGQANYHCANMFMAGLMAQRRLSGLAASVIDIGLVVDIGYVARAGRALIDHLVNLFYTPLSESDVHQLFAEAILASPVTSTLCPEIIMGIEPVSDLSRSARKPPWYHNPIFSHLRLNCATAPDSRRAATRGQLNTRDQLQGATSLDEAGNILLQCFTAKLGTMLNLPSDRIDVNTPLIDIGLDSLLAVEIRQWFLTEIHVDIPVLKVLSGDTVAEICCKAAEKYSSTAACVHDKTQVAEQTTAGGEPPANSGTDQLTNGVVESSMQLTDGQALSFSTDSVFSKHDHSSSSTTLASITPAITAESTPALKKDFQRIGRMTHAQSRLWLQQCLYNDPTTLNVVVRFNICGPLDTMKLAAAVQATVGRHESLHSCYYSDADGKDMVQAVFGGSPDVFTHVPTGDEHTVQSAFRDLQDRHWDLQNGDAIKATLISTSPDSHSLVIGYHHIIMDGISWHLFLRDLNLAYQAKPLPPVAIEALDVALDEAKRIQNANLDDSVAFWRRELLPLPGVLPLLPFSRANALRSEENFNCCTVTSHLSLGLTTAAKQTSRWLHVTPFHSYLAIVQVLLFRLAGTSDFALGITDANRPNKEVANTVGFFLNMVPFRADVRNADTFSELVKRTGKRYLSIMEHSMIPYDEMLSMLNVPRSSYHSPVFQAAFNYRVGGMVDVPLGDCRLELDSSIEARSPYDIVFNITQNPTGAGYLQVTTHEAIYAFDATQMLSEMYISVLEVFVNDASQEVRTCPLRTKSMDSDAMSVSVGSSLDFGWSQTLGERFEAIVAENGVSVAVKDGRRSVSYKALWDRISQISQKILERRAAVEARIAVFLQPSIDSVAAMMAAISVGCVYVPIDQTLPEARQAAIVADCKPTLILSDESNIDSAMGLAPDGIEVVNLSLLMEHSLGAIRKGGSHSPAFLLYTSGSTGVPKGILLSQRGYINYFAAKTRELSLGKEIVLQQSSLGFDMSIAQIGIALLNGGTLVIVPQGSRGDPVALAKVMTSERVTFTIATPSEYLMLLQHGADSLRQFPYWRHACLGGEPITDRLKQKFLRLSNIPRLTDCYGPTEISAATSFQSIGLPSTDLDEPSSVGRAIPNTSIYILGGDNQLAPVDSVGEICVSGCGIALGYWDKPDLTEQKFLPDPYASPSYRREGRAMLYKTGDLGKLTRDGRLIFLGRLDGDTQVKLRGIRIDLDDVATGLIQASSGCLVDAVVTVRRDPDFLVAHVVAASGQSVAESELQSFKKRLPLPQYMCPAQIILVDSLPLTANGKVDRKALQRLPLPRDNGLTSQKQPLSVAEGELRLIWQDVLKQRSRGQLGPESNFFMEGGNSILLVKLQGEIRNAYDLSIPLKDLYRFPTISQMTSLIEGEAGSRPQPAPVCWEAETALPARLLDGQLHSQPKPRKPQRKELGVILTGSTGFLGSVILDMLLEQPRVGKVHCLAVEDLGRPEFPKSDKVHLYPGSLRASSLGIAPVEFEHLMTSVGVIIHAGADGHCLNNYSSLRTPNFVSTRFLVDFALLYNTPLHYVSSNRVILLSGDPCHPPAPVSQYFPPADGSEGFTASKWASERYLEHVAQATGLPVCIHRPCAMTGEQAPSEDALNAILRFSRLTGTIPQFHNMRGFFDFHDVNVVASQIVQDALASAPGQGTRGGSAPATFRHHSSRAKVPVADMRLHMESIYGRAFESVPLREWTEKARSLGLDPLVASYLEGIESRNESLVFPFLGATEA